MSYNISLYRKENKEQNDGYEFLENDDLIIPFTNKQFEALKNRLLKCGFKIGTEQPDRVTFSWIRNIEALLTKTGLFFSSGFSVEAIFEISLKASEFTDTGEFAKLDWQQGGWEEPEW